MKRWVVAVRFDRGRIPILSSGLLVRTQQPMSVSRVEHAGAPEPVGKRKHSGERATWVRSCALIPDEQGHVSRVVNQGRGQYGTVQQIPITAPEGVRFVPDDASGDAVLVIAGSSGRVDVDRARVFAEHGFIAESIRWFGGPGQHAGPWEVPLECFFDRIAALESVSDRVWVVGTSLGAEAALLIAAHLPSVAGVIAFAPSDVVWSWTDEAGTERSHWTLAGSPLPFVPLAWGGYVRETPPRFRPLYEQSYAQSPARVETAGIPVEQIQQLVLVAGGDDQVWPSSESAHRISSRRRRAGLETTVVTSADAGHRTILPGETVLAGGQSMQRGGSEHADRALGRAAWAAIRSTVAR